tara:strand:- start:339 stop:1022 length:684 start_codon:yes stop_codon:yes gene_type:complete
VEFLELKEKIDAAEVVLISDESISGRPLDIFEKELYPNLECKLTRLLEVLNIAEFELFLSVRKYSSIYGSTYSQVLRGGSDLRNSAVFAFNEVRENLIEHEYIYSRLINRIRERFDVPVNVIKFEDITNRTNVCLEKFASVAVDRVLEKTPRRTKGFSPKAVRRILAIKQADWLSFKLKMALIEILIATDFNNEKFTGFDATEIERLDELYQADLSEISQMVGVSII